MQRFKTRRSSERRVVAVVDLEHVVDFFVDSGGVVYVSRVARFMLTRRT